MTSYQRPQRPTWLVSLGLALAGLLLYLTTLAPTVLEADSGEFQFVAWLPGIAHPTGYPLYVLLGWLWTHLIPFGEVAWRMNLLSALFAAATVGLLYQVAHRLFRQSIPEAPALAIGTAAAGTALIFAVTPTFWSQAIIAEVYALHALFVTAVVWLALRLVARPGWTFSDPGALWLTGLFGLSLTHHRTMILLLPVIVLFLWVSREKATPLTRSPSLWLRHLLLFLMPLLLYLYLPLIAPTTPYTTLTLSSDQILTLYDNSWAGFWDHVTGTVFTGELQPTAAGWERFRLVGDLLWQQFQGAGILLAAVGLFTLAQRRRFDLLLLTGLSSLAFTAFNLIYFIGDVFVLFIPVWLFVSLWLGLGGLRVAHEIAARFVRIKGSHRDLLIFTELGPPFEQRVYRLITLTLIGLILGGGTIWLTLQNISLSQADNVAARDRWLEILAEPLPTGAVLISNDRNEIMPLWYYQYVEQRRPDLLGLFPLIVTDPAYRTVGRVLDQALASGRPVYVIKSMPGLSLKADLEPAGSLYRATAIDSPPTTRLDIDLPPVTVTTDRGESLTETIRLRGYDVTPTSIRAGQPLTVTLRWHVTHPLTTDYTSYVHLIDAQGQGLTQSDQRPGGDIYPSSAWAVGEQVRDRHTLTLPEDLEPGRYQLRVGLYYQPEPGVFAGMGPGEIIGHLTVF